MSLTIKKNHYRLGLLPLVMIAIVSVDSLRNVPINAQYGFSLITFYLLAAVTFFLPLAWITAKLAAAHPNTGGSYLWIEQAFGGFWGYLSIWLQWVYNMIWYPTIFTFINVTLASMLYPGLENNKWFILLSSLGFFWLLSLLHGRGIRMSTWLGTIGAVVGVLIPMTFLMVLAGYSVLTGHASATPFNWMAILPDAHSLKNLGFFSNILFSLLGLEVIAMHAGNVHEPQKTYPRALALSAVLILLTLMGSSLALCIILPAEKIALVSGLMDVFQAFFTHYAIPHALNLIGICIIVGGLAIASSWIIGLARGLHVALCSLNAPAWFKQTNRHQMPAHILFFQGIVYSVLLCTHLLFPNINSSYWILSALTAQFALLYYILLFCAAIKLLRQTTRHLGHKILQIVLPVLACMICLFGIVIGFLPPEQIPFGSILQYEIIMLTCFVLMGFVPALILKQWK